MSDLNDFLCLLVGVLAGKVSLTSQCRYTSVLTLGSQDILQMTLYLFKNCSWKKKVSTYINSLLYVDSQCVAQTLWMATIRSGCVFLHLLTCIIFWPFGFITRTKGFYSQWCTIFLYSVWIITIKFYCNVFGAVLGDIMYCTDTAMYFNMNVTFGCKLCW